ncbi:HAD family hydrolase [Methanosphaera sp. WGK6]|uniref:HAD family hydrolase n=1 Tax=Methanosphaera sp. WGK6 TaxID=1561964 RepID=UPI00084C7222|nr:HAD family hydrolase [Methanosphaera sp. WGK6]OED30337.1 hypothetical protein NL43_02865 [Methanosphaera sp. WGK6]
MKKLYIFDFDGMLVDTIKDSIYCVNQALKQCGKPTYDKNLKNLYYKEFRQFLVDNGAPKESEVYHLYNEIYAKYEKPNTKPYNGIIEVLETLHNKNKTLAICSNKEENYLKKYTEKMFKNHNFKYISGHRTGIPDKPNPYRLNEIIKKENIKKEEVIYFGDKDVDIEAARNAGIDMVIVTYGQGNNEDYQQKYPLKVINTPKEILEV